VNRAAAQPVRAFRLDADALHILDQRALPREEAWLRCTTVEEVALAIETLAVRGAPAIGGAAALGMVIAARTGIAAPIADARLRKTRPTAVNLFAALDFMRTTHGAAASDVEQRARTWLRSDEDMCAQIGAHGAALFADGDVVITICHTGALATCGQGTALGVIKSARAQGKDVRVVALETRPLLQGARLTAWECEREAIPCTLITDGMSAFAIKRLGVTRAIVGADRIARDGSTANKIGTYALATVCAAHGVPFYVAAPSTTIDASIASGDAIPIEERAPDEVRAVRGTVIAPPDVRVWNPAFDVTPSALIAGIVTERGVEQPPFRS
jgi:methylthioribose-1-phosphate isomerase